MKLRTGNPSPWRQYPGALVAAGAYVGYSYLHDGDSLLAAVSNDTRSDLYISLSASAAALLGFVIAAASILAALGSGPRLRWLRQQPEFQKTRNLLMGAMHALAVAAALFTVLIVVDTGKDGCMWWEAAGVAVLTLVLTRLVWLFWLLDKLLHLSMQDDEEDDDSAGEVPGFTEPEDPE